MIGQARGGPSRRAPLNAGLTRDVPRPARSARGQRPDQRVLGGAAYRPSAARLGNRGGTGLPRRHLRPRLGLSCAARGLFHTGINREDIDQASSLQNPPHRLLRGCQRQVTAALPSPFPYSQQHRQAAVADALQARQVHDDRWPAGRYGHDQMGRDTGGVGQVELPAQGDDGLTVEVTDYLAKSRHQMLPASWRHSPTANSRGRRGPEQQPEVITGELTTAITRHSGNHPAADWPAGVPVTPGPTAGGGLTTSGSAGLRGWLVIGLGDDVCGFRLFPQGNSSA